MSHELLNSVNKYTIMGIYRPPDGSLPLFSEKFEALTNKYKDNSLIICGVLNVDLLN